MWYYITRSVSNARLYNSVSLKLNEQYDASLMTYFIIHGWNGGDYADSWGQDITEALLKRVRYSTLSSYCALFNKLYLSPPAIIYRYLLQSKDFVNAPGITYNYAIYLV